MQPVKHPKSLNDVTADESRHATAKGGLALSAKRSARHLANLLGVSRAPKRGSFLWTPDPRMVDDLRQHRVILKTTAPHRAIMRNHIRPTRHLTASCSAIKSAMKLGAPHADARLDHKLHTTRFEISVNRVFDEANARMASPLKMLVRHFFTITTDDIGQLIKIFRANPSAPQDVNNPATSQA